MVLFIDKLSMPMRKDCLLGMAKKDWRKIIKTQRLVNKINLCNLVELRNFSERYSLIKPSNQHLKEMPHNCVRQNIKAVKKISNLKKNSNKTLSYFFLSKT